MAGLTACHHEARYLKEAETHYQQGLEQRAAKQSEAAAESFSQALLALEPCKPDKPETKRMKAQIEDNLGFCYWKHELFSEALPLHEDAAKIARELGDSTLLMNALRNCGRAAASLGDIDAAEQHYDEALDLAKALNNKTMQNEILLESSRDVFIWRWSTDFGLGLLLFGARQPRHRPPHRSHPKRDGWRAHVGLPKSVIPLSVCRRIPASH